MEQDYQQLFMNAYEQFMQGEYNRRVIDWDEIERRPGNRMQYFEYDDEE